MARFSRPVDQQYISQFAPEDLGFQQNYFDNLQANQNSYRTTIGGLNKDVAVLPNDTPSIIEAKKQVEARLEQLRGINFNDPKQQQTALKEVSGIRSLFSPQGLFGAAEEKRKKYEKEVEEINKDKNDFKKALRLQQLQATNLAPEAAVRLDSYGRPVNTQVVVPEDFEYKDKTKVFSDLLKDVMANTRSVNPNLTTEQGHEALLRYMSGNIEERTGEKIYNTLKQSALSDPNLMKSIQAEGAYFKQDPNKIFEDSLQAVAGRGKYVKDNTSVKYQKDDLALAKAKQALSNEENKQRFTTETGAVETGGSWAKVAGLDSFYNEDGTIKSDSPLNSNVVTYRTPNGKTETVTYNSAAEKQEDELKREKQGFVPIERKEDKQSLDKKIIDGQTALFKKTSALGLNVLRPDGTVDSEATKQNAINYFKGLSVYSDYTVPFINADIVKNISNDLFGKVSNIHNMEIYEQGNPDSKGQYETKESKEKFKNSKAVGLDYTASKPGAMKIVTSTEDGKFGDTPFIAISRNKTLQQQMAPIQDLTVKSLNGAKTGQKDKAAAFLTNNLASQQLKDIYGHTVTFESLGIPVGSSIDTDGTLRISYLDNSTGTPMIQVLEKSKKPGSPVQIKSLDEVQEEKTGEIFNVGGALSQYQKQSSKTVNPSVDFDDNSED